MADDGTTEYPPENPENGKEPAVTRREAGRVNEDIQKTADEQSDSDPDFVVSLARGLNVIRSFASMEHPPTIADISRITKLSRAAVRRLLLTLERLGYVASDGRTFRLEAKTLALSHAYLASNPMTTRAQEVIDRVAEQVQESCSIAVLDDEGLVTFVARSSARRIFSSNMTIGARMPAFCTSVGRVLLAYKASDDLDLYFRNTPLKRYTTATETNEQMVRGILEDVRQLGYSLSHDEFEEGLASLAVPLGVGVGVRIEAAIGVASVRRPPETLYEKALSQLQAAAEELSMRMSF